MDQGVKSVAEQTRVEREMIVVDDASAEGTPALIAERHPRVSPFARLANLGFAAGSNQGVKLAWGRYRVLLNPYQHGTTVKN